VSLGITTNSQLTSKLVPVYCPLTPEAQTLLTQAIDTFKLSARSYHKVIKLARTIADLSDDEVIDASAIAEALQYRPVLLQ
jgi:magnesium chelatase family protein